MFNNNKVVILILLISIIFIISLSSKSHSIEKFKNNNFDNYKLHFIVLEKDKSRINHVNNLINTYNIRNYKIIRAIDGTNINKDDWINNNYIKKEKINKLRSGALGCALSNITLWEKFVTNNKENILVVFEDDVYFTKNFKKILVNYINNLPNDFDISQLLIHESQKSYFNSSPNINAYVKKGYPQYGTVGYILSKKGAKKLLNYCKPIYTTIDNMIFDQIRNNRIISYVPRETIITMPYNFKSNIWSML